MTQKTIIWFRNDLRIHDNALLHYAKQTSSIIIPIYCIDPRQFDTTFHGFPKTGAYRAQFLMESLTDLKRSLQELGSNLVIRYGKPEEILPKLASEFDITHLVFHREVTSEEIYVEDNLKHKLKFHNIECQRFWGSTLYRPQDLPFAIKNIPKIFTQFRKDVEKKSHVQRVFPTPKTLPPCPNLDCGEIPTLKQLKLTSFSPSPRSRFSSLGMTTLV